MSKQLAILYEGSRMRYEALYGVIKPEFKEMALMERPDVWRNSLGFYYGHTVAFMRSKLRLAGVDLSDHSFDNLLERGVSPNSPGDIEGKQDFPVCAEIERYIAMAEREVRSLFSYEKLPNEVLYALRLGIEHEMLHLQTSVPLLTQLDECFKYGNLRLDGDAFRKVEPEMEYVFGGAVKLGLDKDNVLEGEFHWDNEFGHQFVDIPSFRVGVYPITVGDVVEFVNEGGYEEVSLWDQSEGSKNWFEQHCNALPFNFGRNADGRLIYKTLQGSFDVMPLGLPASLNAYEADAITKFMGGRPISEGEWVFINEGVSSGNTNLRSLSQLPVLSQEKWVIGNQAIWTCDSFYPLGDLDSFEEQNLYPGFSSEWFGEGHRVIKGCSFAGSGDVMISPYFRDFMQCVIGYTASTYLVKP